MKKQLLTMAIALGMLSVKAQNSNTHQSVGSITTTGYSLSGINDVIVNSANFIGLCQADSGTKNGMAIVKSDINNGTSLAGKVYYTSTGSYTLTGQRILSISTNYYVMANYITSSNSSGTAFLKINASTGAVTFAETIGNFRTCALLAYQPVDMVYDGSTYIYMTGYIFNSASQDIWVAKFDLSGNLQWLHELINNSYDEGPQNIYYQNDSAIYIGGISDSVGIAKQNGLMVQIDHNANILNEKTINCLQSGASPRMVSFNLVRNGSNLYAVGDTHVGADGIGPLLVEKLDLTMSDVAHSVYAYTNYGTNNLWFQGGVSKIYINNSHIVVPATDLDANILVPRHYLNAFFNLSTTFLNANVLNQSLPTGSNYGYGICTYPYPTATDGYIYTFAKDNNTTNGVYYSKGSQDHDYTNNDTAPCDTTYPLIAGTTTIVINSYSLTSTTESNKVCSFSTLVSSPAYSYTQNCAYCPSCQRDASTTGIEKNTSFTNSISVSPNPSSGQFNFAVNLPKSTNLNFTVVNALGQVVFTKTETNVSYAVISYDLSVLNKGMYFVNIIDASNNKTVKKIMIE